jgi:CO/xanthine dehydrogenase Mo-binding subunit
MPCTRKVRSSSCGAAQGIGWALSEEYIYNGKGQLDNPGFLYYRCPVASDVPMIEAVLVEVPNPRHPFGARGVGEVPIVPPMAVIANSLRYRVAHAGPVDVATEGAGRA